MPEAMSRVYIALLHHPVYNKNGEIVTSAVTNLDIHDIARVTKTYGLGGYFIVNPDKEQRKIALDICRHWTSGFGSTYNKARKNALSEVSVTSTLEETIEILRKKEGVEPELMATSALEDPQAGDRMISYREAGELIAGKKAPVIILFGTGWGLSSDTMKKAKHLLPPISAGNKYNHLSVRSAVSIITDRLFQFSK
ncbi:MAG: RNA methyltransferase [Proteobacteria bacterium]|nr:RNA methyltransferase [Pseudomonadota bacterium]